MHLYVWLLVFKLFLNEWTDITKKTRIPLTRSNAYVCLQVHKGKHSHTKQIRKFNAVFLIFYKEFSVVAFAVSFDVDVDVSVDRQINSDGDLRCIAYFWCFSSSAVAAFVVAFVVVGAATFRCCCYCVPQFGGRYAALAQNVLAI